MNKKQKEELLATAKIMLDRERKGFVASVKECDFVVSGGRGRDLGKWIDLVNKIDNYCHIFDED